MKKYFLALSMVLVSMTAIIAQEKFKPIPGSISVEVGFSPFAANGESIILPQNSVYGLYTASEDFTIRLGLGFTNTTTSSDDKQSNWTRLTTSGTGFLVKPGILYTYDGTARLTPYIGAEFMFGTTSDEQKMEHYDGSSVHVIKKINSGGNGIFNTWGVGVITGFNYYFAQNLYIGAEVGIGYMSKSLKNPESSATGQPTVKTEEENKFNALGMYAVPALRLGWAF